MRAGLAGTDWMERPMAQIDQDDVDELTKLIVAKEREEFEGSLLSFVREAWTVLEPETEFVENWHIVELCKVLEDIYSGRLRRVIINVPPGTMKSLLVNVLFPCWIWAKNPRYRVLSAAYSSTLSTRDNLKVRDVILSPWFRKYWDLKLDEDQNTKTRFNTGEKGWRFATSVGGPGTGEHPDLILIDDALTAAQAESEPERFTANRWFDRTISSRGVSRNVAIIVIGQRLHEDDLPGYLLKKGGWHHVCFPMKYEPARPAKDQDPGYTPDPRDPRKVEGELLMPQLFDAAKVAQLELDLGPYGTAGQLQQHPSPEGGGLFKREYFAGRFVDRLPALFLACRGWDTAGTENGGDWTVGVKLLAELEEKLENGIKTVKRTGRIFIADVQRDQLSPDKVDALILTTAELDGKTCAVREEKEGGSAGVSVINAHSKLLAKYDYEGVTVSGSKPTRARSFRSQCAAGNVYLLRATWNEPYIQELCAFPTAAHDDQVDGSSTAYNHLVDMDVPTADFVTW
jgi:predicted phage terminase large subunit-like protein